MVSVPAPSQRIMQQMWLAVVTGREGPIVVCVERQRGSGGRYSCTVHTVIRAHPTAGHRLRRDVREHRECGAGQRAALQCLDVPTGRAHASPAHQAPSQFTRPQSRRQTTPHAPHARLTDSLPHAVPPLVHIRHTHAPPTAPVPTRASTSLIARASRSPI